MTKEIQMTNAKTAVFRPGSNSFFELRHYLVIRVSSFVIWILVLAIRVYQLVISPAQVFLFGPAGGCRFTPSCSQYAMEALRAHGAVAGTALAARRVCRCHPFGACGHDPVPKKECGVQSSEFGV